MANLEQIISEAYAALPNNKKLRPWSYLNHGIDILNTQDDLNCYLAAYGKMHAEKIHTALSMLTDLENIVKEKYQIVDWGCGQGLATICFFEEISKFSSNLRPQSITLIEPSIAALSNAKKHLELDDIDVTFVEKEIDNVTSTDYRIKEPVTINFFSNILDIESINLERLAELIKSNLKGEQYFICVGPMNATSTRIDTFAKLLNCTDEQLIGRENGKLKTTRGTIKLLVFKIKGSEVEIIKSIYYPPMPQNNNIMHILDKKLRAIPVIELNSFDRIMEYYKLVVELERLKEPQIKNEDKEEYSYILNENNEFEIDLESNQNFLNIFNTNRDRAITQWTKDLNISIDICLEEKKYSILNFTYLHEDINEIDTSIQKVKLKLSSFDLNYSTLTSKFEKDEDAIDELENLIKQQKTLEGVINILRIELDNNLTFDNKLSFALSSKNPALSQIYSELRKVNSHTVAENSLLSNFLFNIPIDNNLNDYSESDLIQISDLDDSQKNAVLTAFNNIVTVITGPPGSGKTQVISNILANAVLQNKKVLVASKNNQAVDNVKSRFDREENTGFFLRFGNKKILGDITLPEINRISALKLTLLDNAIQLKESQEKLHEITKIKTENKRKLEHRVLFQSKLPEIKRNIEHLENNLLQLTQKNPDFENLRLNHNIGVIEKYQAESKKKRNQFELKYSGMNKLWIDWFTKKKYAFELISFIDETHKDFKVVFKSIPNQITDFKNGTIISETYNEIVKTLNSISDYFTEYSKKENEIKSKIDELKKVEDFIKLIDSQEAEILRTIANCEVELIKQSKVVLKEKIENKLFNSSHAQINNYKDFLPDSIPSWPPAAIPPFINATKSFLDIFNIISVTSLSAKASLPLSNELFDMVVIDEASQCDIASAIPLILRAKQLVVIGDPLQLKHITSLNKFEEEKIKEHLHLSGSVYLKYKEKSLWDYTESFITNASNNNKIVNIDRHYRCHPNIISYSNEAFYNPKLGVNLKICTKKENFTIQPSGIEWIDVKGTQRANNVNINDAEVLKSIEKATYLANQNPNISIGIVTPFRHQANEIISKLSIEMKTKITVGTAHEFQGDEKDVMIYSLVVTNNSPDSKIYWIDNMVPESVNVAVTRARNTIYIVGNKEYIKSKSNKQKPLGKLVDYVEKLYQKNGLI